MRKIWRRAVIAGIGLALLMQSVAAASGRPVEVPGPDTDPVLEFEEVVFVDPAAPFHGGPPPHTATDEATDFRLTMGGISWPTAATVEYEVSTAGCGDDCDGAITDVNAGFDVWEVSDVTFTQNNGSLDLNPCTRSRNSVSWAAIDGPGGTLAQAFV